MNNNKNIPEKVKIQIRENRFCPVPFIQLQLNPLGNISACCFSGEKSVGNIKNNTIEKIWNGEEIQKWRREFLEDEVQICKHAMEEFQCHKNYQYLNEKIDYSIIQKEMPRKLDIRLNGMCNLECIMCDVWRQPNGLYDKSDFWEIGPDKIFPYLLEVDILGGEPFIQKDTYRFIDEVITVNPKCTFSFITNAHYNINNKIRELIDKIEIRHIHFSIDAITQETYGDIRLKGNIQQVFNTIDEFIKIKEKREKENRNFILFASICLQKKNCHELPKFLEYCEINNLIPIVQSVIVGELDKRKDFSLEEIDNDSKLNLIKLYKADTPKNYMNIV